MKNSVYNVFEDVNEAKFPGFKKVIHQSEVMSFVLSVCLPFFFLILSLIN